MKLHFDFDTRVEHQSHNNIQLFFSLESHSLFIPCECMQMYVLYEIFFAMENTLLEMRLILSLGRGSGFIFILHFDVYYYVHLSALGIKSTPDTVVWSCWEIAGSIISWIWVKKIKISFEKIQCFIFYSCFQVSIPHWNILSPSFFLYICRFSGHIRKYTFFYE